MTFSSLHSLFQIFDEEMPKSEKRMATYRCAELMATSIANKLDEVWISPQPVLSLAYIMQYTPTLGRR